MGAYAPEYGITLGADTSALDASITVPLLGAVNPWLLGGGIALLALVLTSGEGRGYTREKTKRVRSAIHGARMGRATSKIDAAKKRLRAAEKRLEALEQS